MNIAHLSVGDPFTARLANNQANNGHNVHLIMLKKESEIFHGVNKYYLPFKPPLGYILNFFHLRKLLKIINPDIFHVHYASGNGFLGRLGGVRPSVLSAWGSDVMVVPKKSKIMYEVVKKNLNHYDVLIATSRAMIQDITATFNFNHVIQQIPIGIELDKFKGKSSHKDRETLVIGTVKTMKDIYGIDTLLGSFKLLLDRFNEPLKLLIAGDGPQMDSLVELAKELGISQHVEFVGYIKNQNVPEFLSKIDIFVNLSRIESFGVAVLEASAMELPVVTTNIGGLPEVVQEGLTGYMVDVDDMESCSVRLLELASNPALRTSMGQQGRKFVKDNYDWVNCYEQVMLTYSELLR
jgi:glycosyltransferase involved in cell wall biosynthesis